MRDTPAKYVLALLVLAYLAELAALFWAGRKFRGAAVGPWRFGDVFTLAGFLVITLLVFNLLCCALPFPLLLSAMLASLSAFGLCALSFALVLKTRGAAVSKAFALDVSTRWRPSLLWVAAALAASWVFSFAYFGICELLGIELKEQTIATLLDMSNLSGGGLTTAFLLGALLVPALEELLFRGIIYQSLLTRMKPWLAIPISATLFAMAHFDLSALPPIFVMGCVLAYVFERTRSLRLPIAIHCVNNAIFIGIGLLAR